MTESATAGRSRAECRTALHDRYRDVIAPDGRLTRALVSFQANRREPHFSWFKYKEAFSATLAQSIITEYATDTSGCVVLDPFAGVGTTLFVARSKGLDSIGIELLPVCAFAIDARLDAERLNHKLLNKTIKEALLVRWDEHFDPRYALAHVPITKGAFPRRTERAISGYRSFVDRRVRDPKVKKILNLAALSVLETVSYTRKDGQYLRWDRRARNRRIRTDFDKGRIPSFDHAIREKLRAFLHDLSEPTHGEQLLFPSTEPRASRRGTVDLRIGSCLKVLPTIPDDSVGVILTSPPYCNRYDYTRTYALELVYLGLTADHVKQLRQAMLSCTVENRTKVAGIRAVYSRLGILERFQRCDEAFRTQEALHEVLSLLERAARLGRLNNVNIPRMVRNYFYEMCVVIQELARVLVPGGRIIMVNDNVRYHGEEVPVDLILSDLAASFGLQVQHIWTLARGKGNSSQQMGAHGRTELRKCVYVWQKPRTHPSRTL